MPAVSIDPFDPSRLGRWESCAFPERPPDQLTEFVLSCPACVLKLERTITHPPPPGAFDGYWRERDNIRARLRAKGLIQ